MRCKNCKHEIFIDGVEKDSSISHESRNGGYAESCPECGCKEPKISFRRFFCKSCGNEIKIKKKGYPEHNIGKWHHVDFNNPNMNAPARVGYYRRELGIESNYGCKKPEPEKEFEGEKK